MLSHVTLFPDKHCNHVTSCLHTTDSQQCLQLPAHPCTEPVEWLF